MKSGAAAANEPMTAFEDASPVLAPKTFELVACASSGRGPAALFDGATDDDVTDDDVTAALLEGDVVAAATAALVVETTAAVVVAAGAAGSTVLEDATVGTAPPT